MAMYKATPKFVVGSIVQLREARNAYVQTSNGKSFLVTFTKGHQFKVTKAYVNLSEKNIREAFEDNGDIYEPEFYYEVESLEFDFRIFKESPKIDLYENDLKRSKIMEKVESEVEEIQVVPTPTVVQSPRQKTPKSVLKFRPRVK